MIFPITYSPICLGDFWWDKEIELLGSEGAPKSVCPILPAVWGTSDRIELLGSEGPKKEFILLSCYPTYLGSF